MKLETRLNENEQLLATLQQEGAALESKRTPAKERLNWLKGEAAGLRYPAANGDQAAQNRLAANESESAALATELEQLNAAISDNASKQEEARAEGAKLALTIQERDYHALRLESLETYKRLHETIIEVERLREQAAATKKRVFDAVIPLRGAGFAIENADLPPGADAKKIAWLNDQIEKERAALAIIVR